LHCADGSIRSAFELKLVSKRYTPGLVGWTFAVQAVTMRRLLGGDMETKDLLEFFRILIGPIGALTGALGGVFLSNRANQRRLQTQLAFDEKVKALERLTKLRTDVYLAAAAANTRVVRKPLTDLTPGRMLGHS
jgi:hypothetical protein